MSPIPVVIIGRNPAIATKAAESLAPEYDAIHIILSEEQGLTDLPLLLSDPPQIPPHSNTNHGSQNYSSSKVLAVAAGGGFNDQQFQLVKDACKDVEKDVVWVRADVTKVASMPPRDDTSAYGTETGKRIKNKLNELRIGKENGQKSGVYYFT